MDYRIARLESEVEQLRCAVRDLHAELNQKETKDPSDRVIRESDWNSRMTMAVTLVLAYGFFLLAWAH